jgi:hypothetical protein
MGSMSCSVQFFKLSIQITKPAGNGLSNALNEIATKPSPAALNIQAVQSNDAKSASRLFQLPSACTWSWNWTETGYFDIACTTLSGGKDLNRGTSS